MVSLAGQGWAGWVLPSLVLVSVCQQLGVGVREADFQGLPTAMVSMLQGRLTSVTTGWP